MYSKIILILIFIILSLQVFGQDIEVTTPEGKKVILKPDKTWLYKEEKTQPIQKSQARRNALESDPKPFLPPILPEEKTQPIQKSQEVEENDQLYVITDVDFILDIFKSNQFRKSEFETEEEYISRIEKTGSSLMIDGKKIKDVYLLLPKEPSYSAEERKFEFYYSPSIMKTRNKTLGVVSLELVKWGCRNLEKMINYGSNYCGGYEWNTAWRYAYTTPEVSMSPDEAKIMKSRLKVAASGIPVELDSSKTLKFKIISLIIFDSKTGKVYARQNYR